MRQFLNTFVNSLRAKMALLMFFLGLGGTAMADTKLYIEDFSIGVGETKTLAIMLDNSEAAWGVNATITLPDGLSVDFNEQNQVALTKNADRFSSNMQASLVKQNDGSFKFLVLTVTQAIKGNEGALVSFDVKNTGLRNNSQINMKDIKVVDKDGKSMGAPKTYNTNVVYKSYLDGVNEFSFAQEQLVFYPNVEADLNVALKNDADNLAGMEATFTVPDGVTISDEAVASETRAENMIITVNKTADKTYRVRMFPSAIGVITLPKITGNDGVLFTLKVKAAETVATGAKIRMNSVQLIDSKSVSYDREDDIEISMFNQGAADEAAAKAAAETKVGELKTAAEALAVSAEAKAYEAENVQAKVATAEQAIADANTAIAAVEAVIAEGKLATDNKEALATAIATAETKIADAQTAINLAQEAYVMQKAADDAEAAAKAAAETKVGELKTTAEALAISAEAKAYEAENVQAKVATAEQAIADANTAIAAVETVIAEGKLATDNKEALATAIATAEAKIADAQTAINLAQEAYVMQKAADDAEAAAKAAAETKVGELKTTAEALAISAEAKAYEAENVQAKVATAEQAIADANTAIAAVEAVIAEGKLATDNKEALATAIATAETKIADAQTAINLAQEAYVMQKAADDAEAAAVEAANTKLGELKTAAEALAVSAEAKAYEAENVKTAVAAAEQAIADANTAIAAVEAVIAEGKLATDNKEALATAIATAEAKIATAQTAIAAAEKAYADQKAIDDAAEAGAKASAEASVTTLKVAMEEVVISEEAKAYEAENVKAAVAAAEQAIADANAAIKAVEDLIAEGKLATDNKEAIARAILAAQKAVNAAADAAANAETVYAEQKAADEAAAAEAAAKTAAETKLADLKTAAAALAVSAEAKAYEAENVQAKVADAEQAIADANTAIAAVEAVIAEGKLATDNKEALATAIATAEQAIADAQTAIQLAEEAYVMQKAADEAAAALAAAKTALEEAITAAKAAETEGMTEASVQALNDAIAAAEAALAAETATVESLTAALTALNAAVAGLTPIPVPVIADGTYYIKNVASGNFLTGANSWGTQASVAPSGAPFEMVFLPEGGYSMKYILSTVNNKFLGSNLYVDSTTPAGGFVIAKNEDGTFAIKLADKYLAEGTNKGSTNDAIVVQTEELTDAAKWQILTLDEAVAAMKNAAPAGATFLISNPNFNRNTSTAAWTVSADCTNKNLGGGDNGNFCAESYHSPFTISQVLANAPAGKYQMTAQGFYRQDDGAEEAAPVFFANDKEAQVPVKTGTENSMTEASHSFTSGLYTIEPIEFTVFEDGQLTIGVKNNGNAHQWVIWDNFQITYLSSEIPADEFAPAYLAALAAAQAALADEAYASVTGDEKAALEQAIAEYSEIAEPSIDTYKAAIAALNAATSAFTGAKGAYDTFNNTAAGMANVLFPYASSAKKAAAEASIAAAPKSAAEATALTEAVLKAYRQYAESSALLEGVSGSENVTATIVNPNAEEAIAEPWAVVLGEGSGGSLGILNGEPLTDGDGNSAYKYFDGGNWGATAWDVALEQTITLPAGKYYLTASGRASADVDLNLFAGETTTKFDAIGAQGGLFGRGWSDASVEFEMTEAGDIKIGVRGVTEKQYNWMSFTRFRLVKFAEIVVNPDDDVVVAPEGWTNLVANGNLAGDLNANYFSKESPSSEIKTAAIVAGAGKNHSRGIVVKSADEAEGADAWNTQFWIKANQSLPIGTKLHVEFDYAASQAAKASTQSHGENPGQYLIWHCIGDVNFTTEWQHFSADVEVAADMANMQCIAFNLAEVKTATEYYFDNFGVWAQIPEPVQEWENLIVNSDIEGESMECFYVTEQGVGGPFVAIATEGIGKDGSKAVKVQSADDPDDPTTEETEGTDWDSQFFIRLPYQLPAGTPYKVSFDYKADKAGDFDTQAHANPGQYIHWAFCGSGSFTTEWQTYEAEGTVPSQCDGSSAQKTFQTIAFNLAKNRVATEFVFDNVKFFVPKDIVSSLTKNPDENPVPYPTGIKNVMNEMNAEGIFNLNGQKVMKAQKGLYIINGKKVVIK